MIALKTILSGSCKSIVDLIISMKVTKIVLNAYINEFISPQHTAADIRDGNGVGG